MTLTGNIASATPEFTTSIKHFPAAASAFEININPERHKC